jgi:hypothetical protein
MSNATVQFERDMHRRTVSSSSIRSVGYDATIRILEVEFWQGEIYRYTAVPRSTFEEFLNAQSKGDYFNTEIRDRFSSERAN